MDIYKCPFFKKIKLLYFKKKTHISIYNIYVTLMVIKEEYTNFSLFSNFAKSKNPKNKNPKNKNQKSKKSKNKKIKNTII